MSPLAHKLCKAMVKLVFSVNKLTIAAMVVGFVGYKFEIESIVSFLNMDHIRTTIGIENYFLE